MYSFGFAKAKDRDIKSIQVGYTMGCQSHVHSYASLGWPQQDAKQYPSVNLKKGEGKLGLKSNIGHMRSYDWNLHFPTLTIRHFCYNTRAGGARDNIPSDK